MALTNLNSPGTALSLQSVNSAQIGRFLFGAFIPRLNTTGLTAWRDGIVAATQFNGSNGIANDMQIKALTPTPSLTLTCEAGHCVITRAGNGPYLCYIGTQGQITLAAAHATLPRIDRIVARVYDAALSDVMPTTPALASPGGLVIEVVSGAASGSPSAPAAPTGSITLATVAVAATTTAITNANITDARKSAMNPGGARQLLPGDALADVGGVTGDLRYSYDGNKGGVGAWTGTDWQRLTSKVLAQPGQTGSGSMNSGDTKIVSTMSIPDIGGSYILQVTGSCEWSENTTNQVNTLAIEARLNNNTWDDNSFITKGVMSHAGTTSGVPIQVTMPLRNSGSLTGGSNTVYFLAKNIGGNALSIAANPIYSFNCTMVPVF